MEGETGETAVVQGLLEIVTGREDVIHPIRETEGTEAIHAPETGKEKFIVSVEIGHLMIVIDTTERREECPVPVIQEDPQNSA